MGVLKPTCPPNCHDRPQRIARKKRNVPSPFQPAVLPPIAESQLVFGSMVLGLSNVHGQMTSSLEYACARSSVVVEARIVEYELHESRNHGWWERLPITAKLKVSRWFKGDEAVVVLVQYDIIAAKKEIASLRAKQEIPKLDQLITSGAAKRTGCSSIGV